MYHIIPGIHYSSNLIDGMQLQTLENIDIPYINNVTVTVEQSAGAPVEIISNGIGRVNAMKVLVPDIPAAGGQSVIHVVDAALAPG